MTNVVRAKKKRTALANMMKEIGLIRMIKMTGRKKAPGPRMKDWWEGKTKGESARTASLGKPTAGWRALYPPRRCLRASHCRLHASVLCGRAFHRSVDELLVDGEPQAQTLGCGALDRGPLSISRVPRCGEFILRKGRLQVPPKHSSARGLDEWPSMRSATHEVLRRLQGGVPPRMEGDDALP